MDMQEKRRKAVLLRLAGKSYREISAELGVTHEMVRRYLKHARETGEYRLSLNVARVHGLPADEAAQAIRQYLDKLGLWHPDKQAPPEP